MRIAAAAEALSDVILPSRGMLTVKSHCSETSRPMPKPSDPMTSAAGPVIFVCHSSAGASAAVP